MQTCYLVVLVGMCTLAVLCTRVTWPCSRVSRLPLCFLLLLIFFAFSSGQDFAEFGFPIRTDSPESQVRKLSQFCWVLSIPNFIV